ncbi:DUF1876 domain-containing protein [Streptomyces radicis]|uniref:DUF1876 domain-containing protein n=1 Tax=Streptomyces radicis TaxID=1750517 RepID=A0A3A9WGG1_9ACTN|nr:DUF1876 domain-containing protein [Streptomyces radicis]RKN12118.1 DUF1876 domain-containing protein [Streptomyces radicis]RKN25829.1 DUF1876 domain-containing protein [Streptomyces radicis]
MTSETWNVRVAIDSDGRLTRAEARLEDRPDTVLVAEGTARANPEDPQEPGIGRELAVARALSELSHQLLHLTAQDIEAGTHHPVTRLE